MPRLTERAVDRAKPRSAKYEIPCSVVAGFFVRVLPSGKKAYYARYRNSAGKDRRVRLGLTTELSFAEASQRALEILHGAGGAPGEPAPKAARKPAKRKVRSASRPPADECPLFGDFAERFLDEYVDARLKPTTQKKYRMSMEKNLLPQFGQRRLDEIEFAEVSKYHASMRRTPAHANYTLALLSSVYSRAIEWGVLDRSFVSPTRGVKKFPTRSRERFLTAKERATLDRFLENALTIPSNRAGGLRWHSVAAIRLLALTGMRRSEVLDLTWEMVDYRHRCFRLPESKTGQKVVPVSSSALELVRECRKVWESCSHRPKPTNVIYSKNGTPVDPTVLTATWCERVRCRIPGFEKVRLHDLRHSAASDALMAGVPLAVVGKILGHRKPETTARYAHIADSVVSDAVEAMSQAIEHGTRTGRRAGRSGHSSPAGKGGRRDDEDG